MGGCQNFLRVANFLTTTKKHGDTEVSMSLKKVKLRVSVVVKVFVQHPI